MSATVELARRHRQQIVDAAERTGVSAVRVVTDPNASPDGPLELLVDFDFAGHRGLDLYRFAGDVEALLGGRVVVGTALRAGAAGTLRVEAL